MTNITSARPVDHTELFNNAELADTAIALEENNVNQIKNQYLNEVAKGEQVQQFLDDCIEQLGEKEGKKKYRTWLKMYGRASAHKRGMERALSVYNFHKQLSKELQEKFVSLAPSWSGHTLNTLSKSDTKQADALAYLIEKHLANSENDELPERVLRELIDSIEHQTKCDREVRDSDWLRVQGFCQLQDSEVERLKEEAKKYKELDPDTGERVLTAQSLETFLQLEGYDEAKYVFAPPPKPNIRKLYEQLQETNQELEHKLVSQKEESDRQYAEAQLKHAQELSEISTELEQKKQELEEAYQQPSAERSNNELTFDLLNPLNLSNTLETELVNSDGNAHYQAIFNSSSLSRTPSYNPNPISSSFASSVVELENKKTDIGGKSQSFNPAQKEKVGAGGRRKAQGFGR